MPDYIFDGALGSEEKELYGKYNWYDWSCKNWGTKWNAYEVAVFEEGFNLYTAWSPAYPVIERLAFLFPEANFIYSGNEPGCCFCFAREYRKGILVYEMDGEYDEYFGFTADEVAQMLAYYGVSEKEGELKDC